MSTDKPKLTVILEPHILDKIEEYRYVHKLRSKSAAAAELISIGLSSSVSENKGGSR